jgi:hypothetical protein
MLWTSPNGDTGLGVLGALTDDAGGLVKRNGLIAGGLKGGLPAHVEATLELDI